MFDFDYKPPFESIHPITSDKLVWLGEARSKIIATVISEGALTPATFANVQEYLLRITGLTPQEYSELATIGMWIGWDREIRDMTEEQKAEYWEQFDHQVDLTPEEAQELEEAGEDFRKFLIERMGERTAFNDIINNINSD